MTGPTRRTFLKGLLATVLAGLFVSAYGFFIEPALRLRVRRWTIRRADWTAPALKIAVLSDFHAGEPWVGADRLRKIVRRTNALGADLVLLLGDFAAGHPFVQAPVGAREVAGILAGLEARHGVFAVLGNHDWWDDEAAQRRGGYPNLYADALDEAAIPVFSNEARKIDGAGVWLAGLEDQLALRRGAGGFVGLDDLDATLASVGDDAPVVLMAHEPDVFPKVPGRVALTLSGHTHGGQFRLFGWSPVVPSRFGNRFAYGHVREDGRDLVVSGGIGCSIVPVRFGVVPEITLVEIAGAEAGASE
ncbi:MAG: metallophosphoesterase [Pseudomonadota bacterium]